MRDVVALREDFLRFRDDVSLKILRDAEDDDGAGEDGPPRGPARKRSPKSSGE